MKDNTLIATTTGPNQVSSYVFKSFGDGWSLQQRLMASNETTDSGPDVTSVRNFTSPAVWGGTILHRGESEKLIHSQFKNGSCLLIWMSDHFLDGWDTAVLTVRAPDTSNDTFHPHCDQVIIVITRYY